jgi:hypothetical protein
MIGPPGPQGIDGGASSVGATGATGAGLFDTTYTTGTSLDHSLNFHSAGTVSGGGRKFPVLLEDGAITFDYIRAQDIFLDSEFVFGINSFTVTGSANVLIGTGNYSLNGRILSATYQTPGSIDISAAIVTTDALSDSGFPVDLADGSESLISETIEIPAVGTSVTFTLGATGSDNSYVTSAKTIAFKNNNYNGVSTSTGLTGPGLLNLTGVLDDNRQQSFTLNATPNHFYYYAYPSRYPEANPNTDFEVGGFDGGFELLHGGATAHTNASSFAETYSIYRSENASLGPTEVVVT